MSEPTPEELERENQILDEIANRAAIKVLEALGMMITKTIEATRSKIRSPTLKGEIQESLAVKLGKGD